MYNLSVGFRIPRNQNRSTDMSCDCQQKAAYALKCAGIPLNIFFKVWCGKHSSSVPCPSTDCVRFVLCPDLALIDAEKTNIWKTVYHGTGVGAIDSILKHGMLLMPGDCMQDGTVIGKRCGLADQASAIWTYPAIDGALKAAGTGSYDGGQTEFKILIVLRQKPETYEVHATGGYGYEIWSTNRRGTLVIEALDVYVAKARGSVEMSALVTVPRRSFLTTFECPIQMHTFEMVKMLKIPQGVFNMKHNRCYCSQCYGAN